MKFAWQLLAPPSERSTPLQIDESDWPELLESLTLHGLGGWVYSRWRGALPPDVEKTTRAAWQVQWLQNRILSDEARALAESGRSRGVRIASLKGIALLGEVYPDPGARCVSDIDLLVDRSHWELAQSLVRARGYTEEAGIPPEYRAFKITYHRETRDGTMTVDLHRKLFFGEPEGFEWQWANDRLDKTDHFMHMMGHLGYQHGFFGLNWLLDLDLFLRAEGTSLDWDRAEYLSRRLGLVHSLSASLRVLEKYLNTPVPEPLRRIASRASAVEMGICAATLSEDYFWRPKRHLLRYFLIQNLVKDSWREALTHDWHWVRRRIWKSPQLHSNQNC